MQERGLLLVTPQDLLSLQLKWHECQAQGLSKVCDQLDRVSGVPYLDIIDESDEVLHHR